MFTSPGPLAEKYYSVSPYAYCAGNPVINIDERGDSLIVSNTGVIIETQGQDSGVYYYENNEYHYIGDLNGIIDLDYIFSNLLIKNSRFSRYLDPLLFYVLVHNHGAWDFKNNKKTLWGIANNTKTIFLFNGVEMSSQDIGNMHYGRVAASSRWCSLNIALKMAGYAQRHAGTSRPEWINYDVDIMIYQSTCGAYINYRHLLPPYGDDPADQKRIRYGYNYKKQ